MAGPVNERGRLMGLIYVQFGNRTDRYEPPYLGRGGGGERDREHEYRRARSCSKPETSDLGNNFEGPHSTTPLVIVSSNPRGERTIIAFVKRVSSLENILPPFQSHLFFTFDASNSIPLTPFLRKVYIYCITFPRYMRHR